VCRRLIEYDKEPGPRLLEVLRDCDWEMVAGAAVSGRMSRQVNLRRVPTKQAQARGYRFLRGEHPATIVSIGNHGFSVLKLRANGEDALYFEALGAAIVAAESDGVLPALEELLLPRVEAKLERIAALTDSLRMVRRLEIPAPAKRNGKPLDPARLLDARIEQKETFICKSNTGCGGAGDLESAEFLESCRGTAAAFGVTGSRWREAHRLAARVQSEFVRRCNRIGRRANQAFSTICRRGFPS